MPTWDIIEPCLDNHLGYGNLDGPVWFIGVEEGGAGVWRYETLTLEESLHLRAQYDLAMDFRYVWEDLYRIPLESWKGGTTWRYIAAFLLSLRSTKPDTDTVRRYAFQDKLLGRLANPSVNALPPPQAILTGKRKQGDFSARREPVSAASTNWPVPIFGRQGT